MNSTQRLLVAGAALLFVAACATTPIEETKPAPVADKSATPAPAPAPAPDSRTVAKAEPAKTTPIDPLSDPNSPLAKRSIYFDFDSFVVKTEYQSTVEAHGRFLVANKGRRATIEGNADERGSAIQPRARQKRADAVKSRLVLLGVTDGQLETISSAKSVRARKSR